MQYTDLYTVKAGRNPSLHHASCACNACDPHVKAGIRNSRSTQSDIFSIASSKVCYSSGENVVAVARILQIIADIQFRLFFYLILTNRTCKTVLNTAEDEASFYPCIDLAELSCIFEILRQGLVKNT